jgi:hypothetical protein
MVPLKQPQAAVVKAVADKHLAIQGVPAAGPMQ